MLVVLRIRLSWGINSIFVVFAVCDYYFDLFEGIDGGWSDFGNWSQCTTTCGPGQKTKTRECNQPPPSNGGAACAGESIETTECENAPCGTSTSQRGDERRYYIYILCVVL